MIICFVLLDVKSSLVRKVFKAVKEIKEVKEVYIIFGEHDIIAKIEVNEAREALNIIIDRIGQIPGVDTHVTYEALEEKSE